MAQSTLLLIIQVVLAAVFTVSHGRLAALGLGHNAYSRGVRLSTLVPPIAAVLAWLRGDRFEPLVFAVTFVAYIVVRLLF